MKREPDKPFERVRIFSDETTRKVRSMMRLAVSPKMVQPILLMLQAILLALRQEPLRRLNKQINIKLVSVVAAFPINDPEYLVFVMVDEPKPQKHSYGYATAGWVAAPVIAEIVNRIAPILNVHPVDINQPEIRQNLEPDLRIGEKGAIQHLTEL